MIKATLVFLISIYAAKVLNFSLIYKKTTQPYGWVVFTK